MRYAICHLPARQPARDHDCGVTHNAVIPAKAGIHTVVGRYRR